MLELNETQQQFILHWGEMGTRWGINRTMAQIHALLYIYPEAIDAETIATTLQVARSNVSTSLRDLQGWGIIQVVNKLGERRDHFTSLTDVWEMFARILEERKKREIEPTLAMLEQCLEQCPANDHHTQQRLEALHDFFATTSDWYQHMRKLPQKAMVKFAKAGSRLSKLFGT